MKLFVKIANIVKIHLGWKTYIVLFYFLMPDPLFAKDCNTNPIYCSIVKINPMVDKDLAFKLSNYLSKYSKIYKTNPYRSVAIIAQESMFRDMDSSSGEDIGIFQFNKYTIKTYNLDEYRLITDLEYATEQHVKLLAKKKEYCQELEEPWACYHSATKEYYTKYIDAVNRYYYKIIPEDKN